MSEAVHGILQLVTLCGYRALRGDHHGSIVPEDVKAVFCSKKPLRRGLDCRKVIKLQWEMDELPAGMGLGFADLSDDGSCF